MVDRRTIVTGLGALATSVASMATETRGKSTSAGRGTALVIDGLDCSVPSESYVRKLHAGGVDCMHLSVEDMDSRGGVHPFVFVHEQLDLLCGSMRLARSVRDIYACKRDGQIALVLGWQGADPIGTEPGTLRAYFELGLRILGIAYNTTNRYGSGCLEPSRGLTTDGQSLVDQAHALDMLLDVGGHTGEQTSLDVIARCGGRPVICSHTALTALNANKRNTSDRVCTAIAATGGVIGVLCLNDYLVRNAANAKPAETTPQAPLGVYLNHLDYLRRLVGVDHVGIGPDFVDGQDLSKPGAWPGDRFTPDMSSPGDAILYAKGFESIDQLPNVIAGLRERGWTQIEITKLLGDNWARVYRAAWGA
jgi:membrane dipeptidase